MTTIATTNRAVDWARVHRGITVAVLAVLALTAFIVAFPGLAFVATEALRIDVPWIAALLPVLVDAGLMLSGYAAGRLRASGEQARIPFAIMGLLVTISVIGQTGHVWSAHGGRPSLELVLGLIFAAAIPVVLLLSVEGAIQVLVGKAPKRPAARRATKPSVSQPTAAAAASRAEPVLDRPRAPARSVARTVVPDEAPAARSRPIATREERFMIAEYVAMLEANVATRDSDGQHGTPSRNVIYKVHDIPKGKIDDDLRYLTEQRATA